MFAPPKSPLALEVPPKKPPPVLVGVDVLACVEADCPKGEGLLAKGPPETGADPNSPPLGALDVVPDPNNPDGPPEAPDPKSPPPWLLDISVTLLIYVCTFGAGVCKPPLRRVVDSNAY